MNDDFKVIKHVLGKDTDNITIYPVSDLHTGDIHSDFKGWNAFKTKLLNEKNSYIVVHGDMMNNATKDSVSNVYDARMRPSEQKKLVCTELSEIRDKILCMVPGNHELRSAKVVDSEPLYDIACQLDLEHLYRYNGAFMKISLGKNDGRNDRYCTYTIACLHGTGGGMLLGSPLNRSERFSGAVDGIDIIITGHTHKSIAGRACKLFFDTRHDVVSQRDYGVIVSAPWQLYGGYALRSMLSPSTTTRNCIVLHGDTKLFDIIL